MYIFIRTFGDSSCFLFNMRKDAKILPMQSPPVVGQNKIFYQWQNFNSFSWGPTDLAIQVIRIK